jgi:taurine dioxygenase
MEDPVSSIEVAPSGAEIGADVVGIDLMKLSDESFEIVRKAALEHFVLRFRDQELTDPGLIAFGRKFGDLLLPGMSIVGKHYIDDHPEVLCVSNIRDEDGNPLGNLGSGEAIWHTDQSYEPVPPSYSILNSVELPPEGGNTYFCNQYLAYETLADDLKAAIAGKIIVHDESVNSAGQTRKGFDDVVDPREAPGSRHPAIRTHPETGRQALYLGRRRNSAVLGMELAESEALLDKLWAHATRKEFSWGHEWRMGDVLMWDNRCTLHRRAPFDNVHRRMMHRIQVVGTIPQ